MFYLVLPPLALPMSLVLIYEQYHPERTWYIDGQQTIFFFSHFLRVNSGQRVVGSKGVNTLWGCLLLSATTTLFIALSFFFFFSGELLFCAFCSRGGCGCRPV